MDIEQRHAFRMPAGDRYMPVIDGIVGTHPLRKSVVRADGYTLHEWPEDGVGLRVDSEDLPNHCPAPEAPVDPAIAAKWEARIALLNTKEAQAADPEAVNMIRDANMSLDLKRAFLRGLPTAADIELQPQAKGTTEMKPYANQPAGKEARALEIRLMGLSTRAANGDSAAKTKMRTVATAKLTAESTGQPLHAVLAAMRADI